MLWFFESFFPVVWIAFIVYWRIKAAKTKTTQRHEPAARGILRALAFVFVIVLLSTPRIPLPWLYHQLWATGLWPFCIGATITVAGLLFAIWARQHLASNWSSAVTLKQDHELIMRGPYRFVRHPIYTGLLLMLGGTTLISGRLGAIAGLASGFLGLWIKLRQEEALMMRHFPADYRKYKANSKALLPFVL